MLQNYLVNINSKDRINSNVDSSTSRFNIRDLVNINGRVKAYLSVPYVNLPPTFNIVNFYNNTLTVIEDTYPTGSPLTFTVSIPYGNYSITDFITAITGAMTTGSASSGYSNIYTGTYNTGTGQLTISIVGDPGNRTFTYSFLGYNLDLRSFMGWNPAYMNVTVPFPEALSPAQPNYSYTSPNAVNFTDSIQAIYLRCNISKSAGGYSTEANSSTNIMKIIPILGNGFSQINYDSYEGLPDQRIDLSNFFNNNLDFFFTNQIGQLVTFQNYDWTMVLLVQYTSQQK